MGKKIRLKFEGRSLAMKMSLRNIAYMMIYINANQLRINLHVIYPNLFVILSI